MTTIFLCISVLPYLTFYSYYYIISNTIQISFHINQSTDGLVSAIQSPKANLFGSPKKYSYKQTKREIGKTDSEIFKSEYDIVEYRGPDSACKSTCGERTEETRSPLSLKRSAAYAHVVESERTVFVSPVRTFRPLDIDCELRARLQVTNPVHFNFFLSETFYTFFLFLSQ